MKKLTELLVAIAIMTLLFSTYANAGEYMIGVGPEDGTVVIEATTAVPAETTADLDKLVVIIADSGPEDAVTAYDVRQTWDKVPYSEELAAYAPIMDYDFQNYIWELAMARGLDKESTYCYYAWLIGLAQGETEFKTGKCTYHTNSNGSVDRGTYQTNSCWIRELKKVGLINSAEDLYDKYVSARCGDYIGWKGYSIFGWDIGSYSSYLYGDFKKVHNNKWTNRVWNMQQNWYNVIFG